MFPKSEFVAQYNSNQNVYFSDDKDIDSLEHHKEMVTAQPLTIVEEDASLSPDDSGTLSHGLLDDGDEEITYQLRSAEGGKFEIILILTVIKLYFILALLRKQKVSKDTLTR